MFSYTIIFAYGMCYRTSKISLFKCYKKGNILKIYGTFVFHLKPASFYLSLTS